MAAEEVVGHPRLDKAELRLGLGTDEVLEVLVSEADRSVCQPHTGSEIGAEIAYEGFVKTVTTEDRRWGRAVAAR